MKPWKANAIAYAAEQRECATNSALCRWCGVSSSTFYRALRDPVFRQAVENARAGSTVNEALPGVRTRLREHLGVGIRGEDERGVLYPRVVEYIEKIVSGNYRLVLLGGGIGAAKTTIAVHSLALMLQDLMAQPNPHESLGLDPNAPIIIGLQNKTARLAQKNAYGKLRALFEGAPWFQQNAPHDQRTTSHIKFLRHNIEIWPTGADAGGLLGMDVWCGHIDEANFFDYTTKSKRSIAEDRVYDQARESFESISRRMKSRDMTGTLFVSSSRRFKGEFLEQLGAEFRNDPRAFCYNEVAWTIAPEKFAGTEWFSVFKGDDSRSPRIVPDDELVHPADRHLIVRVPVRFRREFKRDVRRSLQDLAGISLSRVGNFFTSAEDLERASTLDNVLVTASSAVADAMLLAPAEHSLRLSTADSPRAVHLDLSLTEDATGLCVAYIEGFNNAGQPVYRVDALAQIFPPSHGQIVINSFYELIRHWQSLGVTIRSLTTDQYQSSDLRQRVGALGIKTDLVSADRTTPTNPCEAYETLRLATAEHRISFPKSSALIDELLGLEYNSQTQKIDHASTGSKDLADALCGAIYSLSRVPPWTLVNVVPGASYAAAVAQPKLGGTTTLVRTAETGGMAIVRMLRGMPNRGY